MTSIDYLDKEQLAKSETFKWGSDKEEGWLTHKTVYIGSSPYHQQRYHYDKRGNVTSKVIFGNISGEKSEYFDPNAKYSTDTYVVNCIYSDDGFNNLAQRAFPSGLVKSYAYLPQTNLCYIDLTSYNDIIQERSLSSYDSNAQLVEVIEDDLNHPNSRDLDGFTYRRRKEVETVSDYPSASFGKPKVIKETFFDKTEGGYRLLTMAELSYDGFGQEVSRKISNSKGFCYELIKAYDDRGRVILETNAMGHATRYVYDKNDNIVEEELIGSGKITYRIFDFGNRLIEKKEALSTGEVFITGYRYDALGQCTSEVDSYGNETTYAYDRFGKQILVVKPPIKDADENLIYPTICRKFNALGQMISETDENNQTTFYSYNIFGKPTHIKHPDGSSERLFYYVTGCLKQHWHEDGTSNYYEYDPRGQVTKSVFLDSTRNAVSMEEFQYKGPLLLYKKDARGLETTYEYDGAGRKIKEVSDSKTTSYEYDDFGHVIKIKRDLNQEEIYEYDWLGHVAMKALQSADGQIYAKENYVYDIHGNKVQTILWQSLSESAVFQRQYNAAEEMLWKEDALGNRTQWIYQHDQVNALGQKVKAVTTLDPLNRSTVDTYNALGLVEKREVFEKGQLYSCTEYKYDGTDKLAYKCAWVMSEGQLIRDYAVSFTYNPRGLLASETEIPDGKQTLFFYDGTGKRIRKQKPDGTNIYYTYDARGYIVRLNSSDNTVDYHFVNDHTGLPIEIHDRINNQTLKRSYNIFGKLIKEEIGLGLVVKYEYDQLDRLVKMVLPDQSSICYLYDPAFLKTIQRKDAKGELVYECQHSEHDLRGRLLETQSPVGQVCYQYDKLGRVTHIETPGWKSIQSLFDPVGNLCHLEQTDPTGTHHSDFRYDRFDHLIRDEEGNTFAYDSIGNILQANEHKSQVNDLNQVLHDGETAYKYDLNGNLIAEQDHSITYQYDALNRLIKRTCEGDTTTFTYDAFNRCLSITDEHGKKQLFYQDEQDIGSVATGKIQELRVMAPASEKTVAIELNGKVYFPLQDHRFNICALQDRSGKIAQWCRYLAFGTKTTYGDLSINNPWGFSNRREVAGLVQFTHRFYRPTLKRWLTTDPLSFEEDLNLYTYVKNNPHVFMDPDGRNPAAYVLVQLITVAWGATEASITMATLTTACKAVIFGGVLWGSYKLAERQNTQVMYQEDTLIVDSSKPAPQGQQEGAPPYNAQNFPTDSTQPPAEGFQWRGGGKPGSKEGGWFNPETQESLRSDFDNKDHKPHWDYEKEKEEGLDCI